MENNYSRKKKENLLQTDDATGPVGRWKSEAVEAYRDKAEKIMGPRMDRTGIMNEQQNIAFIHQ
jgi:hypothetical protein